MWCVKVYSFGIEDDISHYHSFHLFTSTNLPPDEAIKMAGEVLPPVGLLGLVRVEYERLPFTVPDCYVAFARGTVLSSTVPSSFARDLEQLRRLTLTLKYHNDDYSAAKMIDALNSLREKGVECRVYEAGEYYHVYASLPSPLPLSEIMTMREGFRDDPVRLEIDKMYLAAGLPYLANSLPNEYFEFYSGSLLRCGREVEASTDNLTVTLDFPVISPAPPIPPLTLATPRGVVEARWEEGYGNGAIVVRVSGHLGLREAEAVVQSIKGDLENYVAPVIRKARLKEKLAEAYEKISLRLAAVIKQSQVTVDGDGDGDTVTIFVPEWRKEYVGRLIGRGGANVRAVEAELGVRIKIVSSSPPPEGVEMRRKLQDLLKRIV